MLHKYSTRFPLSVQGSCDILALLFVMSRSAYAPCEDVKAIDAASVPVPDDADMPSGIQTTCAHKCDRVGIVYAAAHTIMHMCRCTYTMFQNLSRQAHVYTMLVSEFQGEPSQVSCERSAVN